MEQTISCPSCGGGVSSVLDQVLELRAVIICQCACGELRVALKPAPSRQDAATRRPAV